MIINKKILALCDVASSDGMRPVLQGIKIEKEHAIATDGYSMMVIAMPTVDSSEIPNLQGQSYIETEECVLPADDIRKIASSIKKSKHLPILRNAWSIADANGIVRLGTTDLDTNVIIDSKKIEGHYPEYKKVLDGGIEKATKAKIAFDAEKLIILLKAFLKAGAGMNGIVTMKIGEFADPIILEAKDSEQKPITALLMPVRVNDDK